MSLTEIISFDKQGEPERFLLIRKLFLALVIILVATLSFGIGRLTGERGSESIKIEYDPTLGQSKPTTAVVGNSLPTSQGSVIVSKTGTKYHYLHCPGAKQIKETNKITFASAKEAEEAGYTLAANCTPP